MVLQRGARHLYDYLQDKTAGEIVSKADILAACHWEESTLQTYLGKNKLSHVLRAGPDEQHLEVVRDGGHLSEDEFNAVFTQKR